MERLRAFIAEAMRYFGQLSRREKLLIGVAFACFVLFGGSIVVGTIVSSISRHQLSIEDKNSQLQKVALYAQSYAESKRAQQEVEGRLTRDPIRLMTQIQSYTQRRGVTISAMNDRGETNKDDVKESLVELQL